ncbi:alpha/beta hydrolase [Bordetella bronchialis]|uniref:Alpha/beta hydrolase n=1 Tax=Bordetella bronchialis TaxID=463025 RepID=A0ABM6CY35_9BORD|nr:CocE/NonD family hydrolase [Bordetella bronchialis]ANN69067.1 alpha/beta hydrolase [Bordetella bronchialis]
MTARTEILEFNGLAGRIDCAVDWPEGTPRGWALVLHPHPLHEGTRDNKVVTTVARACVQQGLVALRPDFRGVRASAGSFDKARGETADMQELVGQWLERQPELAATPWVLAGFSFGTAVAAQLDGALADGGMPRPAALILAGAAVWRFQFREVALPEDTLIVHGEQDEVVPLQELFDWTRERSAPVVVIPGATHFFHGKLLLLRQLVLTRLARTFPDASAT